MTDTKTLPRPKTRRPRKPKITRQPGEAPSARALAEAAARKAEPRRTVPASWWDEDVAVNMAEYIKHNPHTAKVRRPRRGAR